MKNKKKLLLVSHALTPESYGGVEVYTRNLYEEFKKNEKFETAVLARTGKNKYYEGPIFGDEMDPNLFSIYTSDMDVSSLQNKRNYEDEFKEFLLSFQPDFVHFQHFIHLSMDWFSLVRKSVPSAKVLLTLHEYLLICPHNGQMIKTRMAPSDPKNGRLCVNACSSDCEACFPFWSKSTLSRRGQYVRDCLKHIDLFTAPSHFLRNVMIEKLQIPQEKFICSENGHFFFRPASEDRPKRDGLVLGFLGQINPYKGLQVLLDAMAKAEKIQDIRLKIYGVQASHSDELYFNKEIKPRMSKLKQVEYCGSYTRGELPGILAGLDLVVVPSIWWENSPLVIQEAFMAKVPVICSNIGGMAEKVADGVHGLNFAVNDSEDLFKKILQIYKNKELLDVFHRNIPPVKSISENMAELERLYLSL